ncbi:MAG: MotA/TolQ/ExbB proton channel family protein [Proteobacteria bacterium]|nr:MotA/TolQ/ExbB proton channel family protein [Pseudomonadota bacterium]
MFEMVQAGGWLMLPILLCSVIAVAIIGERFWSLQVNRIAPANLVAQVWQWYKSGELDDEHIKTLASKSALGRILATGLVNRNNPREIMKESIEDVGRQVVHELERFLNSLGTIAAVTPLLGLLGTVIGMIKVFAAITIHGVGNPTVLAGGISEALITTAAGLSVAIPSLIFYRYFRGKVDGLVLKMEEEALKLIDVMHGEREAMR